MSIVEILAVVAGAATALVVAALRPDPSTDWEGRVAVGLLCVIVGGPFWVAQGVLTLLGDTGWLWAWWLGAPVLGMVVPRPPARQKLGAPRGLAEALRLELVLGWQALGSPTGWEPCLTPALPGADGARVWFCFAQAAESPTLVQVAAPWARLDLGPDAAAPRRTDLADTITPIGPQAITPVDPAPIPPAAVLDEWRARNGTIAGHPLIASQLASG